MKKITYLAVCLISLSSFSQELYKSVSLGISKNADVFQIPDKDKKQVSLFFSAKINALAVRFDENFNVIDSLKTEKPSKEYDDIIGYSLSGGKYYTYWSGSGGRELMSQCYDFEAKKVVSKALTVPLEKEKIIKRITVNNVFYMVSILKGTGTLNFYIIKDATLEKKSIDLSSKRFLGRDDKVTTLWDLVSSSTNFEAPYSFQTISTETPPSLALSANKHKIYVLGNKLLFTLDDNRRFTQTFTIDLGDFSATSKMYMQPNFPEDEQIRQNNGQAFGYYYDSNSFFMKDKMVQLKVNSDFMKLSVKDLEGKEMKEMLINNSQEISFKNSDIIQENGSVKSTRILDKTNQLLRKINDINPAISLYENDGKTYMILGGVSNIQQNGTMMMIGGMYGFTGSLIASAITANYSLNNLNSYKQRKVVYINCLFDPNFNHVDGEVKKTAFDELRAFSETKDYFTAPVLFKMDSNLYFGGYDKQVGNYQFYKFKD